MDVITCIEVFRKIIKKFEEGVTLSKVAASLKSFIILNSKIITIFLSNILRM
jgi:hypothetical protein